ncbi:hypothetical protein ES332_D05G454100v1 [Gossypium tomentosum]|uniref:Uncharacterized protein n=1 Tax=Gossypium tomentosum TaxID=34277 RepID=A0A5D2L843_GOSTO|nr:hypothetical protein ES332_D05G454100v1 [Gossypium tomentosum]
METLVVVAQQRNQYRSRVKPHGPARFGSSQPSRYFRGDYSRPRLKYSSTPLTKRPSSPPSSSSSPKMPSPFADGTHSKATRKSSPIPINCSRAPRNDKLFNVEIPGDDGTVSWFLDRFVFFLFWAYVAIGFLRLVIVVLFFWAVIMVMVFGFLLSSCGL